jgi:hypothetical protein
MRMRHAELHAWLVLSARVCGALSCMHAWRVLQVDITVNNMLAIVNTKLLADYGRLDERLTQLAYVIKHWAKRRQVPDLALPLFQAHPASLLQQSTTKEQETTGEQECKKVCMRR